MIADDHAIVRAGLQQTLVAAQLSSQLKVSVVAEACNGFEAIASAKDLQPQLLILDVAMPLAKGTEVVQEVQRWSPNTKIVVYTGISNTTLLAGLISAGVDGIFLKGNDIAEFYAQLPLIMQGGHYIASGIAEQLAAESPVQRLTRREVQILNMVITGKSNQEIAQLLSISPKTVDKHRSNLMAKLDLHSYAELMQYALIHDLVGAAAESG